MWRKWKQGCMTQNIVIHTKNIIYDKIQLFDIAIWYLALHSANEPKLKE